MMIYYGMVFILIIIIETYFLILIKKFVYIKILLYLCKTFLTIKLIIPMNEISSDFNALMPENKDGKQQLPTFFDKPTLWFVIKFKFKQMFKSWFKK